MTIEVGDIVQTTNKPSRLFGALKIMGIEGDNALCTYYLLDKDPKGDERPTEMTPTKSLIPITELTVIKRVTIINQ